MTHDRGGELDQSSPRARAAAISELAAALREDFKGWDAEREAWAKERAELEARGSCSERQVADLKQELKRLGRMVAALKEKNGVLVERNRTLERRNVKMRQHNKAIADKNSKLLSMMRRELGNGGSDESSEGGASVCTVFRKKSTTWVDSSDGAKNTRTAPAPRSANPEDTVPRWSNGSQRHSGEDLGDEEDVATPGRAHGGKYLAPAADGVGPVAGEGVEAADDGRRRVDREKMPSYTNGGTSSGHSSAQSILAKEQRKRSRTAVARVEVDRNRDRSARSSGNDALNRVPLGTSARPSNLSGSDKRLLVTSSCFSSSPLNQRKKMSSRLSLGARDGRSAEIIDMTGKLFRRPVGGPSVAPRHGMSAVSRRSEGAAAANDAKFPPYAVDGDGDRGNNSPPGMSSAEGKHVAGGRDKNEGEDGEGKQKQQQQQQQRRKRREDVPNEARRDCEWKPFQGRRPEGSRGWSNRDVPRPENGDSNGGSEGDGDVSSAPVRGRVEGGGWRREGTGDASSEMPTRKTTTREGVYPPLAMATVHSPKKKGSSARLREQQHEGNLDRQLGHEPDCPLPKGPRVETRIVDVTSTPSEAESEAEAKAEMKAGAADAEGDDDHALKDGGKGNSSPVLSDTAATRTDGAGKKDDPRWQENGVGEVPGARMERKRPVPRSAVEVEVDGEELPPPPRRKHRPDEPVKTNENSAKAVGGEVESTGSHEERESATGGDVGMAAAGQRPFVPNPSRDGGGTGVGGEEEGGKGVKGRGKGVPQRQQQQYKYQEVVRDRARRAAMKGHNCKECEAYLAAVGGSPAEREALLNMCSRHKHTEVNGRPEDTPDGFWDLSFVDSVRSNGEEGKEALIQRRRKQQQQQQQQERQRKRMPNGVASIARGGMRGLPVGDDSEEFSDDGSSSSLGV